jgi:homoserine kinase type II
VIDQLVPAEVLEAFGWPGSVPASLEGGMMNRNWRVETPGGPIVLRRYNPARTAPAILWEHALIGFAHEQGWPVPNPITAPAGTTLLPGADRNWSASAFLEGDRGLEESAGMRRIYGRLLARLHHDLASFERDGQRPGFGKTWELDVMVEAAGAGTFNDLLATFGHECPELAALVRRQRYRNLRELSRLHYPDLPDHPIHGDFQPKNLLFKDGQLSAVLDFDQCRRDALICDIAPLLMPFQPLDVRLSSALLEGYESVRPLSDAEWDLLPALVRASLLWWVAFLLVRWRTQGGEAADIARTMNQRFPAFDTAEKGFRALRRSPG